MRMTIDYDKIVSTVRLMQENGYATASILKAVRKISPRTALGRTWTMHRLNSAIGNHLKRQEGKEVQKTATAPKLPTEMYKEVVEITGTQDWEHNVSVVMSLPLSTKVKKDIVSLLCLGEKK